MGLAMDFTLSEQQLQIKDSIEKLCTPFDDQYWLDRDTDGEFPEDFCRALADDGWLGICMPEDVGGSGLGISEAAVMVQTIAESGAANGGVSSVAIPLFGVNPIAVFGTEEQKQRMLPPVMRRDDIPCFGVTEPNTGLDTTRLKTEAILKVITTWFMAKRSGPRRRKCRIKSCLSPAPSPSQKPSDLLMA